MSSIRRLRALKTLQTQAEQLKVKRGAPDRGRPTRKGQVEETEKAGTGGTKRRPDEEPVQDQGGRS